MRLKQYLVEAPRDEPLIGLKGEFGEVLKPVQLFNDGQFWLAVGFHEPTKKYYGITSTDEVIDKASKQKAMNWVKNFGVTPKFNPLTA